MVGGRVVAGLFSLALFGLDWRGAFLFLYLEVLEEEKSFFYIPIATKGQLTFLPTFSAEKMSENDKAFFPRIRIPKRVD